MSKRTKLLLIIFLPVLAVLIVLYLLVSAVYVPKPEAVVWPQGELTESIFTEQNNKYVKNDSLKVKHEFSTVPYTVDMSTDEDAVVGSGAVYKVEGSDNIFVYATEYNDSTNAQDIISSQFPAVMLINYVPELTRITVQIDKKGFINGFSAEYLAESIVASDGTTKSEAAIIGYALDVPEVEFSGSNLFIGVGTTEVTTENLETCSQLLSSVINTVTKDKELEKKRREAAEKAAEKAEKAAEDALDGLEQADEEQSQQPAVPRTATIPIPIDKEYGNLTITAEWDNFNPNAVLELFNPAKTIYYDPSVQDGMGAKFLIPNGEAGTYELHIANADQCGAIRTTHTGSEIEDGSNISGIEIDGAIYEDDPVEESAPPADNPVSTNDGVLEVSE